MAGVLAFGASVVAFVQIADGVISLSKKYIDGVRDGPSVIRAILIQVSTLRAVLDSLVFLTESQDHASLEIVRRLGEPGGILHLCRDAVKDLSNMLLYVGPEPSTGPAGPRKMQEKTSNFFKYKISKKPWRRLNRSLSGKSSVSSLPKRRDTPDRY